MKGPSIVGAFAPEAGCIRQRPIRRGAVAGPAGQAGVALVVVMIFLVLILGLIVAFYSQSMLQVQISKSSGSSTAVELLAQGAIDSTIGDLKQEIIAGSTAATVGSGTSASAVYYPALGSAGYTTMVPARVGASSSLPNLLKRSAYGRPFFAGSGFGAAPVPATGRAANVSSTTTSVNGRSISAARWNLPLLLPKANDSSSTDQTPVNGFIAPDWILVNRAGGNVTAPTFSGANSVIWSSSAANSNVVVGRYAYAMYDEGGLLDVNVAGYPNSSSGSPPAVFAPKNSLAFADLTAIPVTNPPTPLMIPQDTVNALVGWRNNATLQATGSLPNYSYGSLSTAQTAFYNYATTNPAGFLTTAAAMVNSSRSTDRMFVNRQQLKNFLLNELATGAGSPAYLQHALQYLGTFSRYLDQPSVRPSPGRPKITSLAGTSPATYRGGNDQYPNDDTVNPPFLNIRVATPFLRPDGSMAVVGEPLVKHRFPLSRLSAFDSTTVVADTSSDIYKFFGLRRTSAANPWTCGHGSTGNSILTLDAVAALSPGREPDFFELLKAAICAGSLGKSSAGTADPTVLLADTVVDNQIIQIGVDIIDQTTSSNFPSSIQLGTSIVYGTKDLPYLYEVVSMSVQTKAASAGNPAPGGQSGNAVMLGVPVLWNPVAPGTNPPTNGPTQFRIVASTPAGANFPCEARQETTYPFTTEKLSGTGGADVSWSQSTTGMTFTIPLPTPSNLTLYNTLFREPTPLYKVNVAGSGLALASGNFMLSSVATAGAGVAATANGEKDVISGNQYIGVYAGALPMKWTTSANPTAPTPPNTTYVTTIGQANIGNATWYLQYQSGTNWVTYDQKFCSPASVFEAGVSATSDPNAPWITAPGQPVSGGYFRYAAGLSDPRTLRFGWSTEGNMAAVLNTSTGTLDSWRPATTAGDGANSCYPGFSTPGKSASNVGFTLWTGSGGVVAHLGLFSQNTTSEGTSPSEYYQDPDGVVRGAMGTYATGQNGLPMPKGNNTSRPIMLNRMFRSVGEMGVVFRGTPWKNLDFFTPSSGDAALLDVFCINSTQSPSPLRNGSINLNTASAVVLQSILQSTQRDQTDATNAVGLTTAEAQAAAQALVARVASTADSTKGPLSNIGNLVGRWTSGTSYSGYSADLGSTVYDATNPDNYAVQRYRESAIRTLAAVGNVRVWNMMLDVVAQTGRYPASATSANQFHVEGERRYWVHLAIDRYTGQVLDSVTELVKE